MPQVIIQNWEESERGWGVRPDGYTIHPNRAHRDAFVAWFYATFNNASSAPDEYTRTSGEPFEATVSIAAYTRVVAAAPNSQTAGWGSTQWLIEGATPILR